jgi:hypothetical protein
MFDHINGEPANETEIQAIVEVADDLQRIPTWLNAHEISDLTFHDSHPVCVRKRRCFLRS